MKTYQPNRTKNISIKTLPPLLRTTIRHLVHYQCIQPSPPAHRQFNSFLAEPKVLAQVAGKHFDALGTVLVVQLVQGCVRAGKQDEFVVMGEEVVRGC
jgi:hypothetical protein